MAATAAISTLVASKWNLFPPTDYENCATRAAKDAKSTDALSVLLSVCASDFKGRRKTGGGYTYYDSRQNLSFNIAGPNPTAEEWAHIEKRYASYLDGLAAEEEEQRQRDIQQRQLAALAEEEQRRAQAEQARKIQLAQADLERRRQIALSRIVVTSVSINCLNHVPERCDMYKLTASIKNQSSESISMLSIGWVFIREEEHCPSSFQTKTREQVRLIPGGTLVLNIKDRLDGPASKPFRYCMMRKLRREARAERRAAIYTSTITIEETGRRCSPIRAVHL
jgi:hypothetical protein